MGSTTLFDRIEVLKVAGSQRFPAAFKGTPDVAELDKAFDAVLKESDRLSSTLASLEKAKTRYCVFGGWLRDTLAARSRDISPPRDVDLVVADVEVDTLVGLLGADASSTMFGGVQSSAPPVPFDIWPLHDTFLIRLLQLPATFDSLLKTADFGINAGLYFPAQGNWRSRIVESGMFHALEAKQITFNASHLPLPVMQCARLSAYAAKLDFSLAPSVLQFMRAILKDPRQQSEVVNGLKRYQKAPIAEKAIALVTSIVAGKT